MKFPDDVRVLLQRKFQSKHREWLRSSNNNQAGMWPLDIPLNIPTEQVAIKQPESVRSWIAAWRDWQGPGNLIWSNRQWRLLGTQRVPEKLILSTSIEVAAWIGETVRWTCAEARYQQFVNDWPQIAEVLPKYFSVLADYSDVNFYRLKDMLSWICANPNSSLYPRQLPITGVDSKWLESRRGLVSELITHIQCDVFNDKDFFQRCGLKPLPLLIRLKILDPQLRNKLGGLGDISAPLEQVAMLDIPITHTFIVENLQTGLAFDDLPGAVVIMRLGYGIDILGRLPWLTSTQCFYWGDLDTHGFAILNRARTYLPRLKAVLMDEDTLLTHRTLWVSEDQPYSAIELPLLTDSEQELYHSLKQNKWGQNVRLEQERILWKYAWQAIKQSLK